MLKWAGGALPTVFLVGVLMSSTALAEPSTAPSTTEPDSKSTAAADNYPLRYAARPLTMPRGMLRVTFDLNVLRLDLGGFGSEALVSLNLGVAISPVDNLEIGFSRYRTGSFPGIDSIDLLGFGASGLVSGVVHPETDFGDIPFYLRYQLTSGVADLAVEFRVRFPTLTEWGLAWGLPLRIHAGDWVALDTGVDVALDDPGNSNFLSVGVPFDIAGNVSDSIFLKLQTGVSFQDVTNDPIVTVVPLGFTLGGSKDVGSVMLDMFVAFRFPIFAAFAQGESEVTTDVWTLTFGLNIYTPVLF